TFDAQSGIPNFATVLTLHTYNTPGGKYSLKIIGTTIRDSVKAYDMLLVVNGEPVPCANNKVGGYNTVQTLGTDVDTYESSIELELEKNRIMLKDLIYTDA